MTADDILANCFTDPPFPPDLVATLKTLSRVEMYRAGIILEARHSTLLMDCLRIALLRCHVCIAHNVLCAECEGVVKAVIHMREETIIFAQAMATAGLPGSRIAAECERELELVKRGQSA